MALYLITGGAGFIGSHLADALIARGDRVRVLDDLSTGKRENLPRGAEFIEGDVADPAKFLSLLGATEAEVWSAVGLGEDWRTDDARVVQAALVVDGVALHVSAFPAAAEEERDDELDM